MIEFFLDNTNGTDLTINNNGQYSVLTEKHPLIDKLYKDIENNYTEAFNELYRLYRQSAFFKFLIVRRFLKCNFSKHDERPDITDTGVFDLEFVSCPMRGECLQENIICGAKLNRSISEREVEVLKLIAAGLTDSDIAKELFISIHTAKNHRRHLLLKTDCSNTAALISYANEHNLI